MRCRLSVALLIHLCSLVLGLDNDYRYLSRAVAEQSSVVLSTALGSSQTRDQGYKKGKFHLNVRNLTSIGRIDPERLIANVQTKCTFSQLVQVTLLWGLIPRVVPEFTSITVGGAMVGGGLESTSHRYGQVSDVVQRATVLLGNGTLVNATATSHKDLFHALPGSYGSLGVVLEIDIELMRAQPYVEVSTRIYASISEGMDALIAIADDRDASPVFLEALQFPDGRFVIVLGEWKNQLEESDTLIHPTTGRGLWFYEHIQDVTSSQSQGENCDNECKNSSKLVLETYDYLFRYERGAFWMARPMEFDWSYCRRNVFTFGLFFASWRKVRWLFSDLFSATRLYNMLHLADPTVSAERMVVMDSDLPSVNASSLVRFIRDRVPISTPIWLLPVRAPAEPQPASNTGHALPGELVINVGIYGRVPDGNGQAYARQLTEKVMTLGGRNMMYSQLEMSREEFYRHQIDKPTFEAIRIAYGANDVFPPVEEKVLRSTQDSTSAGGIRYRLTQLLL